MAKEPKCKWCGGKHYPTFCFFAPKKRITKTGKEYYKWQEVRAKWLKANPPDKFGYYDCYLRISPQCPFKISFENVTLDHVKPKGSHVDKRHEFDNLKPACLPCNGLKGSRSLERLSLEYPHLQQYLTVDKGLA